MESRSEELTRQIEDLNRQIELERRKTERIIREKDKIETNNNIDKNKIELKSINYDNDRHFIEDSNDYVSVE